MPELAVYVSFLALIAARWLWDLGSLALAWLALDHLSPQAMIPWRANIHRAFLGEIPYFPPAFSGIRDQGLHHGRSLPAAPPG